MQLNILTLLLLGLTSAFAQRLGDTCQANDECPSTILCDNNVCGGPGACTPDNSSPDGTGLSDQCDRYQICVSNMCDTRIPNGLPCNDPQQCNSDICQLGKCSDGSCSSDSDCPFQCINNQCFKFCDTDSDCPGGLACAGNGRCGDVGASCFPNVYSTDNVGISEQCSSTLTCIDFLCTTPGPNGLGDSCFSAKDCDQSSLHCLRGTCSDLSPALPGDTCEVDQQCIEDGTSCIDYQCGTAPNPGQSEKPIPRRNLQLPWLQAKCARPGDVACPVAGINSRNAYECIDPLSNIESCGGCLYGRITQGVDCTAALNIDVVSCSAGACVIGKLTAFDKADRLESCSDGFEYMAQNQTCVSSV